ncbi:hypothetical protein MXF20_15470 [Pantoea dispersa]|uniref:hypothetical protein n=1 Tax=Pantoea dispersa TaxID=59814 RepID=UPI002DB7B962|nr:hypothetical protein [Pantoea dispersa]MEB5973478.1 hypothetical protein [Pantoea dispersa]
MILSRIKWDAVAIAVLLLVVIALCVTVKLQSSSKALLLQKNAQLTQEGATQSAVIATQSFQFNRFNTIASAAQQSATRSQADSEEREIEYRQILVTEKTCDLPVPAAVAGRLLDYANRLRASAMRKDTRDVNQPSDTTTAAGALTYCQAVLWIDPLLTTIESANGKLAAIRQIELERQK